MCVGGEGAPGKRTHAHGWPVNAARHTTANRSSHPFPHAPQGPSHPRAGAAPFPAARPGRSPQPDRRFPFAPARVTCRPGCNAAPWRQPAGHVRVLHAPKYEGQVRGECAAQCSSAAVSKRGVRRHGSRLGSAARVAAPATRPSVGRSGLLVAGLLLLVPGLVSLGLLLVWTLHGGGGMERVGARKAWKQVVSGPGSDHLPSPAVRSPCRQQKAWPTSRRSSCRLHQRQCPGCRLSLRGGVGAGGTG